MRVKKVRERVIIREMRRVSVGDLYFPLSEGTLW